MVERVRTQVAEHELQLDLSKDAKELLVDKGWDPAMGARPLRRAIQRYVEDPLADEVLKAGQMAPGSTVQVDRDPKGDEQDTPLKLKIVKPRKRPAKKAEPEKVGVGAKKDGDDDGPEPTGDSKPSDD
jgi:ATP-dependent Clp protease ATP-binding subunit ClpC